VIIDDNGAIVPNSRMRKALYRAFTYLKFGHHGKGSRILIPSCVTTKIREKGFHEE
jgi:hypothetical protein